MLPIKGSLKIFFGLPINLKSIRHGITFKKLKWESYATCMSKFTPGHDLYHRNIGTMYLGMT